MTMVVTNFRVCLVQLFFPVLANYWYGYTLDKSLYTWTQDYEYKTIAFSWLITYIRLYCDIQGGPERMQQLWLLISWTSSMKQIFFFG